MIPDADPELERQSFQVADGLEVNLYAADPLLAKPIHINFDAQGRLWVASSEVYPHVKPGQEANDKILVLEDADNDGRAEKTTVFASGLLIPTGIEPGDGGVYVANSTELLHFKDTNGDGRADTRRVMLSGFGTEDTHHILHTLRWGPDGMLYFNQSIYIHSHIETPHGVRRLKRRHLAVPARNDGAGRVRPRLVQSLGPHLRPLGPVVRHRWRRRRGHQLCFPRRHDVYLRRSDKGSARPQSREPQALRARGRQRTAFPDEWQGSLITNDFRGHRVCRFVLTEAGAGYLRASRPK